MADHSHIKYAEDICTMMASAAKIRGTGIAKRHPEYISKKMIEGKAVIALVPGQVVGSVTLKTGKIRNMLPIQGSSFILTSERQVLPRDQEGSFLICLRRSFRMPFCLA